MNKIIDWFKKLSTKGKVITCVVAFFVICAIVGPFLPNEEHEPEQVDMNTSAQQQSTQEIKKDVINYTVVDYEDVSFGEIVRKNLRATISESDMNRLSDSEIETLLKSITQDYVSKHDYVKAVSVMLYCKGDKTDDVYTIAKSDYAPGGEWERAAEGASGNYEGYDYTIDVRSQSDRDMYRELNKK